MIEKLVDIPTSSGRMQTFVTHPEEGGPFPAVVIYMDVWGVREELYEIARRVGTVGYYCLVPDFYYRQGEVRFDYRNEKNQVVSVRQLDAEAQREMSVALSKLSNTMVVEDTRAIIDFLMSGEPVRPDGMGGIGYCMGGRHVMSAACNLPDYFRAAASLHGTDLISDRPDSPHLLAQNLRGELYCGFAEFDDNAPLPMIEELDRLLRPCPVRYRYEIHPGAEHGYALPDRDIHDRRATARDWELIFAMFHRQIPPYAG